ncbi:hypothetical protein [Oscillatoria sp. FACHB-1406]|uniref:hypothetical protein n=1 Tax=Oscillatoria sp. FACHB-1406 TaxID=2692846 RepID=UPI0016842FF2|nr:hypothetical protein [Oscillatoria sp. FACHB-1406]MBD2578638.1 hypothetical protein [Oscillatoria sp. FACHB-1406]
MDRRNVNSEKWQDWDDAFDWFKGLFGTELTTCLIQMACQVTTYGIFKPNATIEPSSGELIHVIKFNPEIESLPPIKMMAFLVNQMVHQWCYETSDNKTATQNYCSEKFKEKAREIGLVLHEDTNPNNKRRNYNVNFDYDPNGRFATLADYLLESRGGDFLKKTTPVLDNDDETDAPLKKGSKVLYICPCCGIRAWGKSKLNLICGNCSRALTEME